LLSFEGINGFIAGSPASVGAFRQFLETRAEFGDLPYKESPSNEQPFTRMLVKIKKEIIPLGRPDVRPAETPAPRVAPKELKKWLDEGKDVVLLDTRNDYEVRLGTFEHAMDLGIATFRSFPEKLAAVREKFRDRTIVMFCTGGIRCEKAAPLALKEGFKDVYQLDGGILRYFEECGGSHYRGDCFVFDHRISVDAQLKETTTVQCYKCRNPLTQADLASSQYVYGQSCPYCSEVGAKRAY
jgi:predicted sulfurtransferase